MSRPGDLCGDKIGTGRDRAYSEAEKVDMRINLVEKHNCIAAAAGKQPRKHVDAYICNTSALYRLYCAGRITSRCHRSALRCVAWRVLASASWSRRDAASASESPIVPASIFTRHAAQHIAQRSARGDDFQGAQCECTFTLH